MSFKTKFVEAKQKFQLIQDTLKNSQQSKDELFVEMIQVILQNTPNFYDQYGYIKQVAQNLSMVKLNKQQSLKILNTCVNIQQAAMLYSISQTQLQIQNQITEKEMRDVVRKNLNILIDKNMQYSIFNQLDCRQCTNYQELSDLTQNIIRISDLLLDFSDINIFNYIAETLIKSLCLIVNQKTESFPEVLFKLVERIDRLQNVYLWQILFEIIFECSRLQEGENDLIQPNLATNLILQQIPLPYIESIVELFGEYILSIFPFQIKEEVVKMFTSLVKFGFSQQNLNLILKLSEKMAEKNKNIEILTYIRDEFIYKVVIKGFQHQLAFNQLLELVQFYIFGQINQSQQIDENLFCEILTNLKMQMTINQNNLKVGEKVYNFFSMMIKIYNNLQNNIELKQFMDQLKFHSKINSLSNTNSLHNRLWSNLSNNKKQKQTQVKFIGFRNLGNTCYMNSFLQALYMTPTFKSFIINKKITTNSNTLFEQDPLLRILQKSFIYLDTVKGDVDLCPIPLKTALRKTYKSSQIQMDAGEFGVHLLEDLEKSLPTNDAINLRNQYVGTTRSFFECSTCKHNQSSQQEQFILLNLPIVEMQKLKVSAMISAYLGEEFLDYNCDFCQAPTHGKKRIEFKSVPENLIIQYNRFQYAEGNIKTLEKIELEYEILIPITQDEYKEYEMYALIVHVVRNLKNYICQSDSAEIGHYYTYARDLNHKNQWILFDDSEIEIKNFQSSALFNREFNGMATPYIFFYHLKQQIE